MAPQNPPRDGEVARSAGGGGHNLRRPEVYEARQTRRTMSLPEVLIWQRLKGSPNGISFRKQHPIGGYRADFYCAAARLIIELDGISHRPERDAGRTAALEAQGYQLLRIAASDVLKDADGVAAAIVVHAVRPLHRPSDGPPPRAGEDFQ